MTGAHGRWIALLAVCLLLATTTSAVADVVRVRLVIPSQTDWRAGVANTVSQQGVPYSYGGLKLCTMPAGVVEITNVRTYGGTGLGVTAFATGPNPNAVGKASIGSSDKPLDQIGFDPSPPVTVETTCPADIDALEPRHLSDFMVQVERPTAATVSFEGMLLDFTDGRGSGTVAAPFGITLCGDHDRTEDCR